MGRLGIFPATPLAFVASLIGLPGLVIEGIFTHLSVADGASEWEVAYTAEQLAAFDGVLADLDAAGIDIPLVHALNSAGLLPGRDRRPNRDRRGCRWSASHASTVQLRNPYPRPHRHRGLRPRPVAAGALPARFPARAGVEDAGRAGEGAAAGQLRGLRRDVSHRGSGAHRRHPRGLRRRLPPRAAALGRGAGARPARADRGPRVHGSDDDRRDRHPRRAAWATRSSSSARRATIASPPKRWPNRLGTINYEVVSAILARLRETLRRRTRIWA